MAVTGVAFSAFDTAITGLFALLEVGFTEPRTALATETRLAWGGADFGALAERVGVDAPGLDAELALREYMGLCRPGGGGATRFEGAARSNGDDRRATVTAGDAPRGWEADPCRVTGEGLRVVDGFLDATLGPALGALL